MNISISKDRRKEKNIFNQIVASISHMLFALNFSFNIIFVLLLSLSELKFCHIFKGFVTSSSYNFVMYSVSEMSTYITIFHIYFYINNRTSSKISMLIFMIEMFFHNFTNFIFIYTSKFPLRVIF